MLRHASKRVGKHLSRNSPRIIMRTKTNIKAGRLAMNHNGTVVRGARTGRMNMKLKTNLKAGGLQRNHNETVVCGAAKVGGLKVKTSVKAGGIRLQNQQPDARPRCRQVRVWRRSSPSQSTPRSGIAACGWGCSGAERGLARG